MKVQLMTSMTEICAANDQHQNDLLGLMSVTLHEAPGAGGPG